MRFPHLLCALALGAAAPAQLVTTFAGGSGQPGSGATQYFDVTFKVSADIFGYAVNASTGGVPTTVKVYRRLGTFVGFTGSSSGWVLVANQTVTSSPPGTPTVVQFFTPDSVLARRYGYAIEVTGNGLHSTPAAAVGGLSASDPFVDIFDGVTSPALFSGVDSGPETWNGQVDSSTLVGPATAVPYGLGCGSPPMAMNSQPPVAGRAMAITVSNIPPGAILGAVAFSGTHYNPGIAPIAGLGTCRQHVGLETVRYFPTTGPTAVIVVNLPPWPPIDLYYNGQAFALAPGFNPAGVASSNGIVWSLDRF